MIWQIAPIQAWVEARLVLFCGGLPFFYGAAAAQHIRVALTAIGYRVSG